ncbi:MAG: hypothetical protein AUH85_01880 [Chloroflexi bacterium 13_1_40CM_4_68_4]|nr:MAG: hypothetical protein AUH85_01880 [Chloroflexi bacterium 13_1_40CM_4_68_4]
MPELTGLHAGLARTLVLYLAFLGVWGIVAWRRGSGISPSYRGALVIAWLTAIAQGALGLTVWIGDTGPRDQLHILYGFALAVALPAGYFYSRDRPPPQQSLVLGLVLLFAAGLAIRGITTS